MIEEGDIVILNRIKGGFFSTAQRFFTRHKLTHTAIGIGLVRGELSVLSSDELTAVIPCSNYYAEPNTDIYVYRYRRRGSIDTKSIIDYLYKEYAGAYYDFLQVFWFVYRWLAEKLHINVKRQHNPLSGGKRRPICSELVFYYLEHLAKYDIRIQSKLYEFTAQTTNVADIQEILDALPSLFECVEIVKGKQ